MNFTEWYQVKDNSKILTLNKEIPDLEKYKNNKYDYIFLNGTLEYAEEPIEFLQFFKNLLNENGRLFIATDNKYGVKYLIGNKSEHCENIYDSLKNKFCKGKLFCKTELDEIINQIGFQYKKYYYPLPNYERPNVIFTDNYLPDKSNSKLNYNVIYDENSLVVQDETVLLKLYIEQNKFVQFTNSYIIELSNNEIKDEVKYYSFNNMRKNKYSLRLEMKNDYVEKYPRYEDAKQHIKTINQNSKKLKELGFCIAEEYDEEKVKSKYIDEELLDAQIVESIENNQISRAYEMIENWYGHIKEKLKPDEQGIVQDGFIDLVFENTFFNEQTNQYTFFDQEWYQKNIPIKFLLYRAIYNLYEHNPKIRRKILLEDIFDRYEIHEEEFIDNEKKIQEEIIDEEKRKFYSEQYRFKISSEEILKIIEDLKRLDKDNAELIFEIRRLNEKVREEDEKIKENNKEKNEIIKEQYNKIIELQKELSKTPIEKIKEKIFKK